MIWSVALLIALLSLAGRAMGHVIFWPAGRATTSADLYQALPQVAHGYASGQVRAHFGVELSFLGRRLLLAVEEEAVAEQVQRILESSGV